ERAVDEDEGAHREERQEDLEEDPRWLAREADDARVRPTQDRAQVRADDATGTPVGGVAGVGRRRPAPRRHDSGLGWSSSSSSPNPRPTSSTKTSSRLGSDFAR